jgi:hypothetical protein
MTPEEASQIIIGALRRLGESEPQGEDFFLDPRFSSVPWVPTYSVRLGKTVWAIELFRGDRVPEATIRAMAQAVEVDRNVQPAFLGPEGENHELLLSVCRENGLALIARVSDDYELLLFPASTVVTLEPSVIRIPGWVIDRLPNLQRLVPEFRRVLGVFARRYRQLVDSGLPSDENQEALLRKVFLSLLKADGRFSAAYEPLELLRFFELSNPSHAGREHYFHTFANFLLGCIVIDDCYSAFQDFRLTCFPGTGDWSIEYVWLLAVLFHDVGHPIENRSETAEMLFGVSAVSEEQILAERKQAWESPTYRASRVQLVSLYDHLSRADSQSNWVPDPFPFQGEAPLDRAFEDSFLGRGHGVASSMRMLADFFRSAPSSMKQRQFLAHHIFVSGLSIPFHDWPVRLCLREKGISGLSTSRFPFAALLMFVDSVQEDRRGKTQDPDLLNGITVEGNTVRAEMNLSLLSPERLAEKKREATDVMGFLQADTLHFQYPSELVI